MNTQSDRVCADLKSLGWVEYFDRTRQLSRCFFKRFETPTRCHCNHDKDGMQVQLVVSETICHTKTQYCSMELELCGELADGTWLKIHRWVLPKDLDAVLRVIPGMLYLWELANAKQPIYQQEQHKD